LSTENESKKTISYTLVRRIITLSVLFGILGGFTGGFLIIRYAPSVIPVDKQQVILQENSAVVDVVKKASPSVVSITTRTNIRSFFGNRTQEGAGTGVIVTDDGLILTNKHVVPNDASTFSVFTDDGKEYKDAKVVARDPQNDIAFVKINARGLKPAELGDSKSVVVGQRVVAIGNALGQFQNTVTQGIISGLGRPVVAGDELGADAEQLENLFQTDAAINPGNSGGPLVSLTGQVIGINTAVAGGENIGFAIPINDAKIAFESYKSRGKITRAYLGVRYIPITKEFAAQNNLPVSEGAYVSGSDQVPAVVPDSPASKAGLREGDIITKKKLIKQIT
jgi:serine protease Do